MTPTAAPSTTTITFGHLACSTGRVRVGVAVGAFVPEVVLPGFTACSDGGAAPVVVFDRRRRQEGLGWVLKRVGADLNSGAAAVVVIKPEFASAAVVTQADIFARKVCAGDELTFPDVLPGFAVPVRRFFE